jgi:hypothetical protein
MYTPGPGAPGGFGGGGGGGYSNGGGGGGYSGGDAESGGTSFITDSTRDVVSIAGGNASTPIMIFPGVFEEQSSNNGYIYLNFISGVPEPTTWAMMFIGFGAVGFSLRIARERNRIRVS